MTDPDPLVAIEQRLAYIEDTRPVYVHGHPLSVDLRWLIEEVTRLRARDHLKSEMLHEIARRYPNTEAFIAGLLAIDNPITEADIERTLQLIAEGKLKVTQVKEPENG